MSLLKTTHISISIDIALFDKSECDLLLNITCNDILLIYVTARAHRCAGGIK